MDKLLYLAQLLPSSEMKDYVVSGEETLHTQHKGTIMKKIEALKHSAKPSASTL